MITSKSDLLKLCGKELPQEEFTTKNGFTFVIQGMKGSDGLRASSLVNLDENLMFVLPKVIKEPLMTGSDIKKLIDSQPEMCSEIFAKGMELSGALDEIEEEVRKEAKKN